MIELIIYIILGSLCGASVRIYHSIHNGLFYNTNRDKKNIHPKLLKFYKNIHFISSPMNYLQQFMAFFYSLAFIRLLHLEFDVKTIIMQIVAAFFIAIAQSTLASYHWQIWINRGSGLPDIDPNENHKSEFAVGKTSFWFSTGKLFNGKRSIFLIPLGLLYLAISITLIILI